MNDQAKTYTLTEAQKELARRECATHGHDWDVVVKFGGDPTHVLCSNCGRSWTVAGSNPGSESVG
jgi:hypothetical protein